MFTGKDFENMGKAAAREYVNSNKPLNVSITKIAEHYGLNPMQVARVVEQANVETYLALNKASEDKYIEFEPADLTKISANLKTSNEKRAV
jgi:replication initiation and membrane attachment protein DnaB